MFFYEESSSMNPDVSSVDNGRTPSDPEARPTSYAAASDRVWRGVDSFRARARRITAGARSASEGVANYVRSEPIKALSISFAVGAALSAVISLMSRSRDNT
jgi:ElaB/YqjD/DUF883 family membrane-anchored ribosome-binding protein